MTKLTCKKGHKWDYQGQNKSGEKATCPKCRRLVTIPSLIIAVMLALGSIGLVYADHPVPLDSWNWHGCTLTGFQLENGTVIVDWKCIHSAYQYQITDDWQPKDPEKDTKEYPGTPHAFIILPPDERGSLTETDETGDEEYDKDEIVEPEEPLTFEERQIEASIKKLDECLRGIGAWAAYQGQSSIEHFVDESRYSFAIRDNLSQNYYLKKILLAIEECSIMRTYERMNLIGAYELNKVLADLADKDYLGRIGQLHPLNPTVTDQGDSMVETDPVTEKDIADEIEDMERLQEELERQRVFTDPDADFTGINRGGQPAGLKCQIHGQPAPLYEQAQNVCPLSNYDAHILKNWDKITYKDILQLQCDNFLYIYAHKIGTDDFPAWLNHCVPKVVRE